MYGIVTVRFVSYTSTSQQNPFWEAESYSAGQGAPPHFVEPEGSWPHSQEDATCPHSGASWIQSTLPVFFIYDLFLISFCFCGHETWSLKLRENRGIGLKNLVLFHLLIELPVFYGNLSFITLFTAALRLYIRWAILIQPPVFFSFLFFFFFFRFFFLLALKLMANPSFFQNCAPLFLHSACPCSLDLPQLTNPLLPIAYL